MVAVLTSAQRGRALVLNLFKRWPALRMYDNSVAFTKRTAPVSRSFFVFLALFALWWVLLFVFYRFPDIDLAVAKSVFTTAPCTSAAPLGDICGTFALAKNRPFEIVRDVTLALPYIAIVVLIATLVSSWRKYGARWRTLQTDRYIAALISLAIGCGLAAEELWRQAEAARHRSLRRFAGFRPGWLVCRPVSWKLLLRLRRSIVRRLAALPRRAAAAAPALPARHPPCDHLDHDAGLARDDRSPLSV